MYTQTFYRFLQFSFLLIVTVFLLSLSALPHWLFVTLKVSPALITIVIAFLYGSEKKILPILIFLFMGSGDLLLGLDRTKFFMFALASFMIANLLLLIYLIPYAKKSITGMIRASVIVLFCAGSSSIILPNSGKFLLPVLLYLLMIGSMAFVSASNTKNRKWLIYAGAFCFLLSDSLIAYDKFVNPVQGSLPVILAFYYTSLYCFCFGIVPYQKPPIAKQLNS